MSGYISIKNGKKGGRPKTDSNESFLQKDYQLVILTEKQYTILYNKYGDILLNKALNLLENWLKTSPKAEKYKGKNNYAHFRSDGWLINYAKSINT